MTSLSSLPGFDEAQKAIERNLSPRAEYLGKLERYVEGTQYEGMADWFEPSVPLFLRKPCIVYTLTRSAIYSNTDFVLGESRWPRITSRPSEDDSDFDDLGLTMEESSLLDKFMSEMERQCRLRSVTREVFTNAQGCGTACAILGVQGGELRVDTVKARWCEPTLAPNGSVDKLEISYPYLEQYRDAASKWRVRARIYRRYIDAERDVTYVPAIVSNYGADIDWVEDKNLTFEHHFGFCPVIWYPFMRGSSVVDRYDGQAVHATLLDEIRALDMALSMRHRAALYAGDPQWTEIGVTPGYVPTDSGDVIAMPATSTGGLITSENAPTGEYRSSGSKKGRQKGPSSVWQYESTDVEVKLHTLPGDAFTSLNEHIKDLRVKLSESLSVIFLDLEAVKFASALSGKALDTLRERQLDRCEQYRDDLGHRFMLPMIGMLLRIVRTLGDSGALRMIGLKKVLPVLDRFDLKQWRPPSLTILWGPFFRPDMAEQQLAVAMTAQAWSARLVTKRQAIEKMKDVFPYESEETILQQLEEEAKARLQGDPMFQLASEGNAAGVSSKTEMDKARNAITHERKSSLDKTPGKF